MAYVAANCVVAKFGFNIANDFAVSAFVYIYNIISIFVYRKKPMSDRTRIHESQIENKWLKYNGVGKIS